jgi:hypothetical protein
MRFDDNRGGRTRGRERRRHARPQAPRAKDPARAVIVDAGPLAGAAHFRQSCAVSAPAGPPSKRRAAPAAAKNGTEPSGESLSSEEPDATHAA